MKVLPVLLLGMGWVALNVPLHGSMHIDVSSHSKNWALTGTALKISSPCADEVLIMPGAPAGQITVNATAGHQDEIDALNINSTAGTITIGANTCPQHAPLLPFGGVSFKLTVNVPAGTNIAVNETGNTGYTLGAIGGDLAIQSNGAGDISAGSVHNLNAALTDNGDVHIINVTGTITASLSGDGDLHIDTANATQTALTLSSNGDAKIDAGQAGAVTALMSGDGDVTLPDATALNVTDQGDGDVTLGAVHGNLNAVLNGAGDLHSAAVAGDATLVLNGAGDANVAHVGGKLSQTTSGGGDVTIGD